MGEVHCNHCIHSNKHNSNHISVHQWIRSAIRASQQPTSPIGFLLLKLPPPPCTTLLVMVIPFGMMIQADSCPFMCWNMLNIRSFIQDGIQVSRPRVDWLQCLEDLIWSMMNTYFINVSPFLKNIVAINICIERNMFGLRDYDLMISQFGGHRWLWHECRTGRT